MPREYYVVQPLSIDNPKQQAWELLKYDENRNLLTTGKVVRQHNGHFESDDIAFQQHRNEKASRRIRVVKEHLKQGEPIAICYWVDKGQINYFKA